MQVYDTKSRNTKTSSAKNAYFPNCHFIAATHTARFKTRLLSRQLKVDEKTFFTKVTYIILSGGNCQQNKQVKTSFFYHDVEYFILKQLIHIKIHIV